MNEKKHEQKKKDAQKKNKQKKQHMVNDMSLLSIALLETRKNTMFEK